MPVDRDFSILQTSQHVSFLFRASLRVGYLCNVSVRKRIKAQDAHLPTIFQLDALADGRPCLIQLQCSHLVRRAERRFPDDLARVVGEAQPPSVVSFEKSPRQPGRQVFSGFYLFLLMVIIKTAD